MRRALLSCAMVAGLLGASAAATPAQAAEGCGVVYHCSTTYYSDVTRTVKVGWRLVECDGTETRGGTVTVWRKVVSWEC